MSSKDCSEVSNIKRVAAPTLQEKQYLAKQQSFVNKIKGNDPDRSKLISLQDSAGIRDL